MIHTYCIIAHTYTVSYAYVRKYMTGGCGKSHSECLVPIWIFSLLWTWRLVRRLVWGVAHTWPVSGSICLLLGQHLQTTDNNIVAFSLWKWSYYEKCNTVQLKNLCVPTLHWLHICTDMCTCTSSLETVLDSCSISCPWLMWGGISDWCLCSIYMYIHEKHVHSTLAKQENLERIERTPPHKPTPYQHFMLLSSILKYM